MSKRMASWLLTAAFLLGACTGDAGADGAASPSGLVPVVSPSPAFAEPAETLDPATAEAQAFRIQYGLRSDLAWIARVAADPTANEGIVEWGVPLTAIELAELRSRHNPLERTATELLTEIKTYGARFPETYAGAYEDQRVAIGFVVMFSGDVERHGAALRAIFPQVVALDVREVRWSLAELDAFTERVNRDRAWLAGRAQVWGAETSWLENRVHLDYFGPVDLAPEIAAHYGNPPWLIVERQGPLPWAGPRGDLVIDVVEADGSPAIEVQCEPIADDPEAREGSAVPFGTNRAGQCVLASLPVGSYEVVFERWVDVRYEPVHSVRVVVGAPGTSIRVVLPRG